MKILLFAHIEPTGGTGTFFSRLIQFLDKPDNILVLALNKCNLAFVSPKSASYTSVPYIFFDKIEHFFYRVFRKLGILKRYLYLRDSLIIKKKIQQYNPDICIISQGGGPEYFPILRYSCPSIIFTHTTSEQLAPSEFNFFKNKYINNKYLSNKNVVFMSDFAKNQFVQNSPFYEWNLKLATIPNYGDIHTINQIDNMNTISVLTMGHMHGYKNPIVWFEVAKFITEKYDFVHFYWAGNGDYYTELLQKSKKYSNIHLLGFISPEEAYKHCDIYFHPSKIETQGITVVEAMALAKPCVVSNAGGLPESVIDGYNGYVCEVNNQDEYIRKLLLLITNNELSLQMGLNSKKIYDTKFSKKTWEDSLSNIIN